MNLTLTASDLWKSYQGNPVLEGCSFTFDKSGIYILTGQNGSGKSTFLRMCALLEKPDRGEVKYLSGGTRVLRNDMQLKRRITLVLPKVGVFNTTTFKNITYGLKIRGLKREDREKRADEMLEFVGLAHKKGQSAFTLSSGETQRLGIARALAIEPEVLFLDEPTASVDRNNTEVIERIILDMRKKNRSIIVIATHDRGQAERLADCLMIMENGRIQIG